VLFSFDELVQKQVDNQEDKNKTMVKAMVSNKSVDGDTTVAHNAHIIAVGVFSFIMLVITAMVVRNRKLRKYYKATN